MQYAVLADEIVEAPRGALQVRAVAAILTLVEGDVPPSADVVAMPGGVVLGDVYVGGGFLPRDKVLTPPAQP